MQLSAIAGGIIDGENCLRYMDDASKAGFSFLEVAKSHVTFKQIFPSNIIRRIETGGGKTGGPKDGKFIFASDFLTNAHFVGNIKSSPMQDMIRLRNDLMAKNI